MRNVLQALTAFFTRRKEPPALSPQWRVMEGGWYVEHEGRRIAALSGPRHEDMFWVSYAVEPLTEDEEERQRMLESEAFWLTDFVYRSRECGEIAENAFPALKPFVSPGRIAMRGLYLVSGAKSR